MPDVSLSTKQTVFLTVAAALGAGFAAGFVLSLVRPHPG